MEDQRALGVNLMGIASSEAAVTAVGSDTKRPLILECSDGTVFTNLVFAYKDASNVEQTIDLAAAGGIFNGITIEGVRVIYAQGIVSNSIIYKDGYFKNINPASGQIFVYGN